MIHLIYIYFSLNLIISFFLLSVSRPRLENVFNNLELRLNTAKVLVRIVEQWATKGRIVLNGRAQLVQNLPIQILPRMIKNLYALLNTKFSSLYYYNN